MLRGLLCCVSWQFDLGWLLRTRLRDHITLPAGEACEGLHQRPVPAQRREGTGTRYCARQTPTPMASRHAWPWPAVSPLGAPSCTRHLPPVAGRHAWSAGWRDRRAQKRLLVSQHRPMPSWGLALPGGTPAGSESVTGKTGMCELTTGKRSMAQAHDSLIGSSSPGPRRRITAKDLWVFRYVRTHCSL